MKKTPQQVNAGFVAALDPLIANSDKVLAQTDTLKSRYAKRKGCSWSLISHSLLAQFARAQVNFKGPEAQ